MKTNSKLIFLLCGFCSMIQAVSIAQKTDTIFIYFKQNSFVLDDAATSTLNNLAYNFYQFTSATIIGRSSEEGTADYNLQLSAKRADAVAEYFHTKKFDGDIYKNIFGEKNHIGNAENLSMNRSVELVLSLQPADEERMQKFITDNYPASSVYDYNVTQGLKVTSDDGTYLSIPPYAFIFPGGQPASGKIEVRVSKIRNMNEIVQSGLNTITDHGPLQTAGMFEIKAFKNKQELKLRKGNNITLNVNADSIYDDMQTFTMNDSSRNWRENNDQFKLETVNYTINYGLFFKDDLSEAEKAEMNKNIEMMKNERRNFLNILLGALAKEHLEDKINRLISLFKIQGIYIMFNTSSQGSHGIALFEGKTQRVLKMNDDQFKEVDFSQTNSVSTTINDRESGWTDQPEYVNMDGTALKYYDVKFSALSIVNIDRFLKLPRLDNVAVKNVQIPNAKTYMIFPALNCLIPSGASDTDMVKFINVPKNQEAVIFAFGIKKGTWYYAKKTITTNNETEELNWIKSDEEAIKREMKNI